MCATCGCGQKDKRHPRYGKGPSGEKSYNMSKAMRNFDSIADALLTDEFEDVEKGSGMDYQRARADMYSALATGNKGKMMDAAKRRKAASDENKRKLGVGAGYGAAVLGGAAIGRGAGQNIASVRNMRDFASEQAKAKAGGYGFSAFRLSPSGKTISEPKYNKLLRISGAKKIGAGILLSAVGTGLATKNENKGKYKNTSGM